MRSKTSALGTKKIKLDSYEQELIDSLDKDWINSIFKEKSEIQRYKNLALDDFKRKSINIRISKRDIEIIKQKAFAEWIPYQTLIWSVLHKFVTKN